MYAQVIQAVWRGDLAMIRSLVEEQMSDVNQNEVRIRKLSQAGDTRKCLCVCTYQNGTTPLIAAAITGHLPVAEYLVERGADLEARNDVINLTYGIIITSTLAHSFL